MVLYIVRWLCTLALASLMGKLITKLRMPSILGWLIVGMFLGPNALGLMPQHLMDSNLYQLIITWMQCAFGIMLGTELIWKKIKKYGKALIITTLTQSLGTFALVSFVFAVLFYLTEVPLYLAFAFGGDCSGDCSGACTFHCTGISHTRSGNGYPASYGSIR